MNKLSLESALFSTEIQITPSFNWKCQTWLLQLPGNLLKSKTDTDKGASRRSKNKPKPRACSLKKQRGWVKRSSWIKEEKLKMERTLGRNSYWSTIKQGHWRYLYLQYSPRAWWAERRKRKTHWIWESVRQVQIDIVVGNIMTEEKKERRPVEFLV